MQSRQAFEGKTQRCVRGQHWDDEELRRAWPREMDRRRGDGDTVYDGWGSAQLQENAKAPGQSGDGRFGGSLVDFERHPGTVSRMEMQEPAAGKRFAARNIT